MQVLLLGLFIAVYLHDATTTVQVVRNGEVLRVAEALPSDVWPGLSGWAVLLIVLVPKLFVGLSYWATCQRTRKQLGTARGHRLLNRLDAMSVALPILLLCLFLIDLTAGALRHLRVGLQHTVLIDELLVMLPTLLLAVWAWAAYYPVDRRLRESGTIRDADAGKPVYPLLTRGAYVTMQVRHQFAILLLPLLVVFAWSEAITLFGPNFDGPLSQQAADILASLGVLAIFIVAPLVIRHVWQTMPLPAGEVRDRMMGLCQQHNVAVRELLLWRTSGRMVNAAVTGLIGKVRYILLSDALLDQLEPREVEAVMAHELAHVKCKHLIWMGLFIITALGLLNLAGFAVLHVWAGPIQSDSLPVDPSLLSAWLDLNDPNTRMTLVSVPAFLIALAAFGWVSRRIERQADVFAVKHLAANAKEQQHDSAGKRVFDETSVQTMVRALHRVSQLNHASTTKTSWWRDLMAWRHGTIAWRQDHLRSLTGQPADQTHVDRVLNRIKLATLAGLVLLVIQSLV